MTTIGSVRVLKAFGSVHRPSLAVNLLLTIPAACLAIGMPALLMLEALGGDPALRPFGTEDIAVGLHWQTVGSSQFVGALSTLEAIHCFVVTAGMYLVSSHRARSALAANSPLFSVASNMAEPWGRI